MLWRRLIENCTDFFRDFTTSVKMFWPEIFIVSKIIW